MNVPVSGAPPRMGDLIAKKREGRVHSPPELEFIAQAAAREAVPDYQLAAWLMAVCLRGMSEAETLALTRAMAASGRRLNLAGGAPKVDKHSTGGVGDGISLALAPLVASAGLVVPMMSGRGLGHTGGTLDKLESVPGLKVRFSVPEVEAHLRARGVCLFGQSGELAPADRKLYALRDATATVESRPLIVASILSKKLAEGLDALVLDVKCGSGAIFENARQGEALARALIGAARKLGLRCVGLLTRMEQPLGRVVGNALEMRQAVEVLQGDCTAGDYVEVLLALGGWMLALGGKVRTWEEGEEILEGLIRDGRAAARLRELIQAQGGDARVVENPDAVLPKAASSRPFLAPASGHLGRLDARKVGQAAVLLGAGRDRQEDALDYGAGIVLRKKVGDRVREGEELARLHASDSARLDAALARFGEAVSISARKPKVPPVVIRVMK